MRVLAEITDEGFPNHAVDTIKLLFCNDELGTRKIKYVSAEDFAGSIKAGIYSKGCCTIGKIPTGYYNASIGIEKKGFDCAAILILPKRMQRITYMQTMYEMELPALVFAFKVEESKVKETHVFCVKENEPSAKSVLYRFPLGNVSSGNGSVCWGGNQLPQVTCLKDLDVIMTHFLSCPFNSDHYRPNENCKMKNWNLRDLCEYVQKVGNFEDDKLLVQVTVNGYRTLEELEKTIHL